MDFTVPADYRVETKESRKLDKKLKPYKKAEKVEYEGDCDISCSWYFWKIPQRPGNETRGTGEERKSGDYPNHSSVKISSNT